MKVPQQVNLPTAEELSRGVSGVMGDLSPVGEIIWSFLCGSRQIYGGFMYFGETVRNSPCLAAAEPQCCLIETGWHDKDAICLD